MNPFMKFSQEHRQSANPGLSMVEVAKILGAMWRTLPDDEKDKYRDDYCSDCSTSSDEYYCGC